MISKLLQKEIAFVSGGNDPNKNQIDQQVPYTRVSEKMCLLETLWRGAEATAIALALITASCKAVVGLYTWATIEKKKRD